MLAPLGFHCNSAIFSSSFSLQNDLQSFLNLNRLPRLSLSKKSPSFSLSTMDAASEDCSDTSPTQNDDVRVYFVPYRAGSILLNAGYGQLNLEESSSWGSQNVGRFEKLDQIDKDTEMKSSSKQGGDNNRGTSGHMFKLHQSLYHALNLGLSFNQPHSPLSNIWLRRSPKAGLKAGARRELMHS